MKDYLLFEASHLHDFTWDMLHKALNEMEDLIKDTSDNFCVSIYFRGYCYVDEKNYAHVILGNDESPDKNISEKRTYPLEQRMRDWNKYNHCAVLALIDAPRLRFSGPNPLKAVDWIDNEVPAEDNQKYCYTFGTPIKDFNAPTSLKYTSIAKKYFDDLTADEDIRFKEFINNFKVDGVEHVFNKNAKEVRIDPKHVQFKQAPSVFVEDEVLIDGKELKTTQELAHLEKKSSKTA